MNKIKKFLKEIENEGGCKIMLAGDIGSFSYGLENSHSNHNILYIYVMPYPYYSDEYKFNDDIRLENEDGTIRARGLDIKKVYNLLLSDNLDVVRLFHLDKKWLYIDELGEYIKSIIQTANIPSPNLMVIQKKIRNKAVFALKDAENEENVSVKSILYLILDIFKLYLFKETYNPFIFGDNAQAIFKEGTELIKNQYPSEYKDNNLSTLWKSLVKLKHKGALTFRMDRKDLMKLKSIIYKDSFKIFDGGNASSLFYFSTPRNEKYLQFGIESAIDRANLKEKVLPMKENTIKLLGATLLMFCLKNDINFEAISTEWMEGNYSKPIDWNGKKYEIADVLSDVFDAS